MSGRSNQPIHWLTQVHIGAFCHRNSVSHFQSAFLATCCMCPPLHWFTVHDHHILHKIHTFLHFWTATTTCQPPNRAASTSPPANASWLPPQHPYIHHWPHTSAQRNLVCIRMEPPMAIAWCSARKRKKRKRNNQHHHHHSQTTAATKKKKRKEGKKQTTKEGKRRRKWICIRRDKMKEQGKGMENWLLLIFARERDLVRSEISSLEMQGWLPKSQFPDDSTGVFRHFQFYYSPASRAHDSTWMKRDAMTWLFVSQLVIRFCQC